MILPAGHQEQFIERGISPGELPIMVLVADFERVDTGAFLVPDPSHAISPMPTIRIRITLKNQSRESANDTFPGLICCQNSFSPVNSHERMVSKHTCATASIPTTWSTLPYRSGNDRRYSGRYTLPAVNCGFSVASSNSRLLHF